MTPLKTKKSPDLNHFLNGFICIALGSPRPRFPRKRHLSGLGVQAPVPPDSGGDGDVGGDGTERNGTGQRDGIRDGTKGDGERRDGTESDET